MVSRAVETLETEKDKNSKETSSRRKRLIEINFARFREKAEQRSSIELHFVTKIA